MNNDSNDNASNEISPGMAILAGIFSLVAACYLLHGMIVGLETGQMAWSTRSGNHGVDFRAHNPGGYWFDISEYFVLALVCVGFAAWMFRHAFRTLRKLR